MFQKFVSHMHINVLISYSWPLCGLSHSVISKKYVCLLLIRTNKTPLYVLINYWWTLDIPALNGFRLTDYPERPKSWWERSMWGLWVSLPLTTGSLSGGVGWKWGLHGGSSWSWCVTWDWCESWFRPNGDVEGVRNTERAKTFEEFLHILYSLEMKSFGKLCFLPVKSCKVESPCRPKAELEL